MTVVGWEELSEGRDGSLELSQGKTIHKYTRVFRVYTDDPHDDAAVVMAYCDPVGTQHPTDTSAYLVSCNAVPDGKSKTVWKATVRYTSERQRSTNPLNDPVAIEWDTDTAQVPFYFDKYGKPILNSADDFFMEPLKDEVSGITATLHKNVSVVPSDLLRYRDAVNSDAVTIDGIACPAGTVKIKKIHIGKTVQVRNGIPYREAQLSIKIQDDWMRYIQDQGIFEKVTDPEDNTKTIKVRIKDDNKRPVSHPVPLDGTGKKLPTGTNPYTVSPLVVDLRKTMSFAALVG